MDSQQRKTEAKTRKAKTRAINRESCLEMKLEKVQKPAGDHPMAYRKETTGIILT
jgi:hypothetical protein